jgi:hypothetical protein
MKVFKYNSTRLCTIPINRYKINWEKAPSKGQLELQKFLYPYWKSYLVLKEMRVPGTLWRFDIVNCNKRLIIEYSPKSHHGSYNKFFHKNRAGYGKSLNADVSKYEWAVEQNGFKLIEITEEDLPNLSVQFFQNRFDINII